MTLKGFKPPLPLARECFACL